MFSPSILDLKSFSRSQVENLLFHAQKIKLAKDVRTQKSFPQHIAALVFFEASTRTRCSFEIACVREGIYPVLFEAGSKTSLEKGETEEDTLKNLNTYHPDFFIIRSGDQLDMREIEKTLARPILNAGWGVKGHPTQALLDLMTIQETIEHIQSAKIVFVGDVRSSRVFSSHLELRQTMGYEIAVCAPSELVTRSSTLRSFQKLSDAIQWGTHFIFLRVQKERHASVVSLGADYLRDYGATLSLMSHLREDQYVMHPGPVNYGVEIDLAVTADPRCLILKQAENGVPMRRAIIRGTLEALYKERE